MEEKETQVVETSEVKKPTEVKSFRCAAPKTDWHIFLISLLTSAIVVAAYHVTLMAIDMFCEQEAEPVYCSCHKGAAEEEEEKPKRKFSPEQVEKMKARREAFMKQFTPEQREKINNMTKEQRREFFKKFHAERRKGDNADGEKGKEKGKRGKRAKKNNAAEKETAK